MADYIKREDAIKVCSSSFDDDEKCFFNYYKNRIENIPAADVVEVVRCGDCRFYDTASLPDGSYYDGICRNYDKGIKGWFPKKDDFCSAGVRRKDNMTENKLWCTDWKAVATMTRIAFDRFLIEYWESPTTVIVPVGTIGLLKKECSEYMSYPDAEPVKFCGLLVRESPRIKRIELLEVY